MSVFAWKAYIMLQPSSNNFELCLLAINYAMHYKVKLIALVYGYSTEEAATV